MTGRKYEHSTENDLCTRHEIGHFVRGKKLKQSCHDGANSSAFHLFGAWNVTALLPGSTQMLTSLKSNIEYFINSIDIQEIPVLSDTNSNLCGYFLWISVHWDDSPSLSDHKCVWYAIATASKGSCCSHAEDCRPRCRPDCLRLPPLAMFSAAQRSNKFDKISSRPVWPYTACTQSPGSAANTPANINCPETLFATTSLLSTFCILHSWSEAASLKLSIDIYYGS